MTAVPVEVEAQLPQPSPVPSSPLSSVGNNVSPPPPAAPLPIPTELYRNATASSSGTPSLQPSPPSAGPSTSVSTPSATASSSAWGSLAPAAQRPVKPLPLPALLTFTPKAASPALAPPPTPSSAPSLPTFRKYAAEEGGESSSTGLPELTSTQKKIAFEHELPPVVFLAAIKAISEASTPEEANKAAGDVLESVEAGAALVDAVRHAPDLQPDDPLAVDAAASFDLWLESREFALTDEAGKAAMRAKKQPLDLSVLTEVRSLLAGLHPVVARAPRRSGAPSREDGPPSKKKRKADGDEDGEGGGGAWRVTIRDKTDDKDEFVVVRGPGGKKVNIHAHDVLRLSRKDREKYGELCRDKIMEQYSTTSSTLPSIFTPIDLASFPLLSKIFNTEPYPHMDHNLTTSTFYQLLPQRQISLEDVEKLYPKQLDALEASWVEQARVKDVLLMALLRHKVGLRKAVFRADRKKSGGGGMLDGRTKGGRVERERLRQEAAERAAAGGGDVSAGGGTPAGSVGGEGDD